MIRRSKTGLVFAGLYVIAATAMFFVALTCSSDWMCDLIALPAFVPAGYLYWLPFSGQFNYIPDPVRRWEFIIPALITNAALYYLAGSAAELLFKRLFNRSAK